MGFLNLSAWRSVGGSVPAERRATSVLAQSPKYYYDHVGEFQAMIDRYAEEEGHRPATLAELYLWLLEQDSQVDDDARAIDLADFLAYYDIEQHSQLAMVTVDPDKATRARKLLEARQLYQLHKRAVDRDSSRPARGRNREVAVAAGQTADGGSQPPVEAAPAGAAQ